MILSPPQTVSEAIPLMLLLAVIGLPGVLILITTGKVVYIFWMLIYLLALPVWNFVLPVYAFWHFDDFSWGQTRKVEGEGKDMGHDSGKGGATTSVVAMRRWEDWERSRLRKIKREEKRRRDLARAFPQGYPNEFLRAGNTASMYDGSDTVSMTSSEEDHWGTQIGTYNENSSNYPLPVTGLFMPDKEVISKAEVVGGDDLAAMLDSGFDDGPSRPGSGPPTPYSSTTRFLDPTGAPMGTPRYQLSDQPSPPRNAYPAYPQALRNDSYNRPPPRHITSPISPTVPINASSSAIEPKTHAKKRSGGRSGGGSGGRYGPLGPLDPGDNAI